MTKKISQLTLYPSSPLPDTALFETSVAGISYRVAKPSLDSTLTTEDQTCTGGARLTWKSLGTISSGTVTPDPGDRPGQYYTNGGAHALAPGTNTGFYYIEIINNASAGAITTSGFDVVLGDPFTTTNGNKFLCTAVISPNTSYLLIQAAQ